jgi:hypothetical protein
MGVINIPDDDHGEHEIHREPEKHHREIVLVKKFDTE